MGVDAELSNTAVAAKVGLPISTVHRKIRRMELDWVIKGYRTIIDYEKTEWPIGVFFTNIKVITHDRGHILKGEIIRMRDGRIVGGRLLRPNTELNEGWE